MDCYRHAWTWVLGLLMLASAAMAQETQPAIVVGKTTAVASLLDGPNQPTRSASATLGDPFVDLAAFRARFTDAAGKGLAGVVDFENVTPQSFSQLEITLPSETAVKVMIDVDAPPLNPDNEAGAFADRTTLPTSGRRTFGKRMTPDHLWRFPSRQPVGFALVVLEAVKDARFEDGERNFKVVVTYDDGSSLEQTLTQAYGTMGGDQVFVGLLAPAGRTIQQVLLRVTGGTGGAYFYIDDLALILGP